MKKTNYPLAILLNVLSVAAPVVSGMWLIFTYLQGRTVMKDDGFGNIVEVTEQYFSIPILILTIALLAVYLALRVPLKNMYQQAVQDNEYDEFGMSKKKSYQNLTRKEREQMDLQKMADMERLLSSSVLKKIVKKGSENPEADLNRLIGIESVKQKTTEMAARMKFEQEMQKEEKNNKKRQPNAGSMSGRHMVFYGSAGTGKTSVVRIITGFLYQYGYIKENKCVEIDGNFLKAGSESGVKTKLICQKAFDGVLFIDEAYSIVEGTGEFGREVIATLIKEMEDNRDRFVLILAGYKEDMNRLLSVNEGFKSRIKEYLYFPDYTVSEMAEIFELMANEQHFEVSQAAFDNFAVRIEKERKLATFGNGRTVRNVLDESIDRHALHYGSGELAKFTVNGYPANDGTPAADCKYLLCGIDVSTEINRNVL